MTPGRARGAARVVLPMCSTALFLGDTEIGESWRLRCGALLGTDLDTIKRLCRDDMEAVDLIDQATKGRQGERTDLVNIGLSQSDVMGKTKRDRSTQQLRHLRDKEPEIYTRVMSGEISVTRAAVEAGSYPRRIAINLQSVDSAARTLLKAASRDYVLDLIAALRSGVGDD